jgi:5-methylcytosine-specific restriction enzyme A
MPVAAPHPCPGCRKLTTGPGRCPACRTEAARSDYERRGSRESRGYGADWQRVRDAYVREHPVCEECRDAPTREVHHVVPVRVDPSRRLDATNLRALCKGCHSRTTITDPTTGIRRG